MRTGPNRLLAVLVGVVVVLGVVAAVVSAVRDAPTYDRATPEGVVQAYLTAVLDRDNDEAAGYLTGSGPCAVEDLDMSYVPEGVRVVLRDSEVTGDSARLEVDVVQDGGGPLAGSGFDERQTFRLDRSGGDWRIAGTPWPMFDCRAVG